ncbi:hypothetical protein BTVI_58340 [Pitangus sulphuratus]|nr:hypothetical protein BTVI_58340 [Pitangus sulphuratus]
MASTSKWRAVTMAFLRETSMTQNELRVDLVRKVEIGEYLGHSNHEGIEFKISVDRRKSASSEHEESRLQASQGINQGSTTRVPIAMDSPQGPAAPPDVLRISPVQIAGDHLDEQQQNQLSTM